LENRVSGEVKEENLVKKTCKELGITQKELAKKIGVKPESLNSSISRGKISLQVEHSLNMLLQINELQKELENYKILGNSIKQIINNSN
jgi:DNA-binding XRE family transcriptional regulator